MIAGFAKAALVGLAHFLVWLVELAFNSDYYYACMATALTFLVVLSVVMGVILKSRLLMTYATVCFVGIGFNALLFLTVYPANLTLGAWSLLEWLYWDATINYCLILELLEFAIIVRGGIDVIYSFLLMRGHAGNSSYHIDARLGVY